MQHHKHKIIISGGGTGGHIFPAIAIANALTRMLDDVDILFIGAKGKMEMEKVPAAGYNIEGLWISGIQRRLTLKNLLVPCKVISSMMNARNIINKFKPEVVIGVGGYASGPTLKVASGKGIHTVLQEQNSFPGMTNRMLAKKASKICVAYDQMERYFPAEKIVITGNPIRRNVIDIKNKKEEAAEFFGLDSKKTTVFVVGGSQGARSINLAMSKILDEFSGADLQLLWQTGKDFLATANQNIEGRNIRAVDFINRMDLAYALSDIVISRAGAIAISELCAVGKPVIFIPLPSAAEDHQMKNAMALVEKNAAVVIRDADADKDLRQTLLSLLKNETKQKELMTNIGKLAVTDADERIANEIILLMNK